MVIYKKKIVALLLIFTLVFDIKAGHIIGGDLTYKYLSPNQFEFTLRFFRDCTHTFQCLPSLSMGIYDKLTDAENQTVTMNMVSNATLQLGDSCYHPPVTLCIEECIYKAIVTLNDNPNGYYASIHTAYRDGNTLNILNPSTYGIVYYAEVADPVLHNSSATFGAYPKAFFCRNQLNTESFSCADIDNDSLVYSLDTLLSDVSATLVVSKPYTKIPWKSPFYSGSNMIGGNPPMKIDSVTGILTATPVTIGIFAFCVKVEEYKNGIKIGEVRRDIEYSVLNCDVDLAPKFVSPAITSYQVAARDSVCFNVKVVDMNIGDSVWLSTSYINFPGLPVVTFASKKAKKSVQSDCCFQAYCSNIRDTPYKITFNGRDSSCYGIHPITLDVNITVIPPPKSTIDTVPNVFTPNGDNINDKYKIDIYLDGCYDTFQIVIYDRWGLKVFETNDHLFTWDGTHYKTGKELPAGPYYYVIEGSFRSESFKKNGVINILR